MQKQDSFVFLYSISALNEAKWLCSLCLSLCIIISCHFIFMKHFNLMHVFIRCLKGTGKWITVWVICVRSTFKYRTVNSRIKQNIHNFKANLSSLFIVVAYQKTKHNKPKQPLRGTGKHYRILLLNCLSWRIFQIWMDSSI